MKALKRFRISLCVICLVLSICSCSKPVEVQIREQLDLGQKYLAELKYEQAVVAFNKAIELDEKNITAYEGLGEANKKLGKTADAISAFEKVIELDQASIPAYLSLSEIYESTGDETKVEECCSRILEINPDNSDAKATLIRQYRNTVKEAESGGSYKRADEYCRKILDIDPEDQEAKNKQESLKILRRQKESELIEIAEEIHGGEGNSSWAYKDFNGDGSEDLFIAIDSSTAGDLHYTSHWTVYYVDSSGDCQSVTEYSLESGAGYGHGGWSFERDGITYFLHALHGPGGVAEGKTIRYYVFTIQNGKPQFVSDGYEINTEDIRAGNVPL